MHFQSLDFILFFCVIFAIFIFSYRNRQLTILFLAAGSLIFYALGGYKSLLILLTVAIVDYNLGKLIDRTIDPRRRKLFLIISIAINILILGTFKYLHFFTENANLLFDQLGIQKQLPFFNLIIPAGISFFTFESLSYIIDIYRRNYKPRDSFFEYILFISYFPHLIAGPIIRPDSFFKSISGSFSLKLENVKSGTFRFLCGIVKKIFIADFLGVAIVEPIFASYQEQHAIYLWLGVFACTLQIYYDFSAYSDMAIGISKCFGIVIPENFRHPFAAKNIKEFWQRWHISLSTWFRDYLYIPLGGGRMGQVRKHFNIVFTMVIVGVWHGASWNQVIWGALNGTLIVLSEYTEKLETQLGILNNRFSLYLQTAVTFSLVCQMSLFHRIEEQEVVFSYLSRMYSREGWFSIGLATFSWSIVSFCLLALILHFLSFRGLKLRLHEYAISRHWLLTALAAALAVAIIVISGNRLQPFLYFKF